MKVKGSKKRFKVTCLVIMLILAAICLIPFWLMIASSLTEEKELIREGYKFFPKTWSIGSYVYLWLKRTTILKAVGLSFLVTGVGTFISVLVSTMYAYPLTRKDFKFRNVFAFYMFFTLLFNGGMTAQYVVLTRLLPIKNTILAYLLPGIMGNVLMIRNYYNASIPYEIQEAARIDGSSEMRLYFQIILPLSKPIVATTALFLAMGYWNNWIAGVYYIQKPELYTLTVYLNKLMNNIQSLREAISGQMAGIDVSKTSFPSVGIRMAIAIVSIIPIMAVFPFVQKDLIEGIIIGGVKG